MPTKLKELTPKETLFVESYCTSARFNQTQAYKDAGYKDLKHASVRASQMMTKPHIKNAVAKRVEEKKNTFAITESEILKGLYDEATNCGEDASSSSRTNAWVWLGKAIGMFEKKTKEEDTSIQINILNYGDTQADTTGVIIDHAEHLSKEEVQQIEEAETTVHHSLGLNLDIADYSAEENEDEIS